MSFQGDVAGIGLGELLQGLARGGRDGVLTLRGKGLGATLGLSGGQLFLLPDPDEDPELWRKRCERAWVKDPNHRIDTLRMSEIAFAARLERMFELLDGEGLHFRFEPGAVPTPGDPTATQAAEADPGRVETGMRLEVKVPVHCHGVSVEFLLLEYARLTDECRTHGDANLLPVHYVPRLLVSESPSPEHERFWNECDGTSNVVEIADRMGWPVRQCKASLVDLSVKGYLRFSDARELLALAQAEIGHNRFARAASRLAGWCLASAPGHPALEDTEMLLDEWQRGKLPVVLASMEARTARTLLRRLDLADGDPGRSVERWKEMRKHHRHDSIAELALVRWRLRSDDEADAPHVNDLLRLARDFQDRGWSERSGVVLEAAAQRLPESTSLRLEVGTRLIAVGRIEEGTHWVLEACRTMIDAGHHEKALGPLRNLLAADKSCREARQLFALARNRSTSGKRTRRLSVVGVSTVLVVSLAALVKVRVDLDYNRRLSEVRGLGADPERALDALDRNFPDDTSERITELRAALVARLKGEREAQRKEWIQGYEQAQEECTGGDELRGLQLALELPPPPSIPGYEDSWPTLGELLDGLGARLEQTFAQFPEPDPEGLPQADEDLRREKRFTTRIEELQAFVAQQEQTFTLAAFLERLGRLRDDIADREDRRAAARERREAALLEQDQNRLLAAAQVHHAAGDLERAVACYRQLLELDRKGILSRVLRPQMQKAEDELAALEQARELAGEGRHAEATTLLQERVSNPHLYMLPSRIDSQPAGVRVRFGDGSIRVTPFRMDVGLDERVELTLEHPGYEREVALLNGPQDLRVLLSREPDFAWSAGARVNALPVAVEGSYVVADRAGLIALLAPDGEARWQRQLGTLGGVARTPAFLPLRQGTLLAVTEDGSAWLVEVQAGVVEGPWNMMSPPVAGPLSTPEGVLVAFADGRTARWDTRLRPEILDLSEGGAAELREALAKSGRGQPPGPFSVLRRSASSGTYLRPPGSEWTVTVEGMYVHVDHGGDPTRSFAVKLTEVAGRSDWSYVAWEAPSAVRPAGRLWVSDDGGLRAFVP